MTSARVNAFPAANAALKGSAALWFGVAATGQLIFAAYIALNYGRKALGGDFAAWSETLIHGIVAGDPIGNIAVGLHLLLALIITVGGPLQLIPAVRRRWPKFHRWNGRTYLVTAFIISLGGLYMVWTRGVLGPTINAVAISINALLIMSCAAMALRFALKREFERHRRWATRLFLVVGGVWFFRVGLMFWVLANGGKPVGIGSELDGPFAILLAFAQYVVPLGVYELYLRTQERAGAAGRVGMAAMLVVLSLATAVGVFGATVGMWLPKL
jgi:hypothetical protein